jgi:hypothetical protein
MYGGRSYTALAAQPYLDVVGLVAADVIVVDRNGIGVKHGTVFTGTETVSVKTYEWYGVKQETGTTSNYLMTLTNSIVGGNRVIVFRVGPTPVVGTVFAVYYGSIIAQYVVQSGDTAQDVRDGLKSAIDGQSWTTTVTTTNIGTNRLQVDITGTDVDMAVQFGSQKYKKGYYTTIAGINYILVEAESPTTWPSLPALGVSYAYSLLVPITGTVEDYLSQPLTVYNYTESTTGTTDITAIPSVTGVTFNECVVDQNQQRVWFWENLAVGEKIKIFQK